MPLTRFEKLEPERRTRLLGSSAQEFGSVGFEGASLGRIAESAGMSKPALYYYFEDKADLYATVVRTAWKRLTPRGRVDLQSLGKEGFWPALEAFHRAAFESARREPWLLTVWKLAYHTPPPGAPAEVVSEVFDDARAFQKALLRRGQELGVVRTDLPEDLLISILTGLDNAADHWLADHWETLGFDEVARLAQRVLETIRRTLAPSEDGEG